MGQNFSTKQQFLIVISTFSNFLIKPTFLNVLFYNRWQGQIKNKKSMNQKSSYKEIMTHFI